MKTIKQEIDDSNQEFIEASPERKRVMIAQDIIARLNKESFVAIPGSIGEIDIISIYTGSESAKDIINGNASTCKVCAKGAIFCSYIGRVNEMSINELEYTMDDANISLEDNFHSKLLEIFEGQQLDLIEVAFEGFSILEIAEDTDKAEEFYLQHNLDDNSNERLKAICKNIIANNGTFIP